MHTKQKTNDSLYHYQITKFKSIIKEKKTDNG
jgi:hypothetical protein